VHVGDGLDVSYTNVADDDPDRALSVFDVRLHLLSSGDRFDLEARRPTPHAAEPVVEKVLKAGAGRR
jgi:cyanophycinase